jgi:hypothetical protein
MLPLLLTSLLLQAQGKPAPPKDSSTLVKVADNARAPWLCIDSEGSVYMAFSRGGNIEVSVSVDGGATFSAPVRALNTQGRDPGIASRGPRIAVDAQKRIYVSAPLTPGAADAAIMNDIYFAVSADKGKTWSRPFPVSDPKTGMESAHSAAAGPGEVHLVWLSTPGGKPPILSYAKFGADGKRVGKSVVVAAYPCEQCPPAITVDGKGNPTIAWRESSHDAASKENRQIFIATSTDGGKSFGATARLNSVDSGLPQCPNEAPALAVTGDARTLAAAWMDRRDLERDANIYWAFGPPGKFGRDTDPHDDRRFIQRRPTLAVEPDGTVWCAWEDGRLSTQRVFFASTKAPANVPLGDDKEGGGFSPCLAAGGGIVGIAYQSGDNAAFRLLRVAK